MNNNHLLEELIASSSNEQSPRFTFESALLDRSVARAVSKSLLKILEVTKQTSNVNNNLRLSVLENIKKMCQTSAQGHFEVDEDVTEMLKQCYIDHIDNVQSINSEEKVNRLLDEFLIKKLNNIDINYKYEASVNPDIIQALLNLNENGVHLDILSDDITPKNPLHPKCCRVRQNFKENYLSDVCQKMKPEIEKILLSACYDIISNRPNNITEIIQSNLVLIKLIERCSTSSECFQICIGILHFLFTMTNFDSLLQKFIYSFVNEVKLISPHVTISVLYPIHLSNIALILDMDPDILPKEFKIEYTSRAIEYLRKMHQTSENNLILLLSHYPQWYDIYFKNNIKFFTFT